MILGPVGHGQVGVHQAHGRPALPRRGRRARPRRVGAEHADDELFEMRKKFGVLFQDGALFGSMNLYDNVAFPLRQHTDKGEDEIGDIVNRRLREVGLARRRRQDAQRAVGRHAQARRLRPRARARPGHRALRRAGLRPGPGPHRAAVRADPGDPRGERRRLRRHHPRHHERAPRRRVHLGAVEGPDRRVRPGRGAVQLRQRRSSGSSSPASPRARSAWSSPHRDERLHARRNSPSRRASPTGIPPRPASTRPVPPHARPSPAAERGRR